MAADDGGGTRGDVAGREHEDDGAAVPRVSMAEVGLICYDD